MAESILSQETTEEEATSGAEGAIEDGETNADVNATASDTDTGTDGSAEGDGEGKPDEKPDERYGAPEAYEPFTVPEGVEYNADVLESIVATAKELNLSQAAAQKLVDSHYAAGVKSAEQFKAALEAQSDAWHDEVQKDADLGGDNFETTLKRVALVRDEMPEFGEAFQLLGEFGLANHPTLVRAFTKLGSLLEEDSFKSGGGAGSTEKVPREKALYPNMN